MTRPRLAVERDLLPDPRRRWTARALAVVGAVVLIVTVSTLFGEAPATALRDPMLWVIMAGFTIGLVIEDLVTRRRPPRRIDADTETHLPTDDGRDE